MRLCFVVFVVAHVVVCLDMFHSCAFARMRRSLVGMAERKCSLSLSLTLIRFASRVSCLCVVVCAWCASCVLSECVVVVLRAWCCVHGAVCGHIDM